MLNSGTPASATRAITIVVWSAVFADLVLLDGPIFFIRISHLPNAYHYLFLSALRFKVAYIRHAPN